MTIVIESVQKKHMETVINMLHNHISEFRPPKEQLNEIWNLFAAQSNVHSVVAILNDEVVGFGSVVIETKIRGGYMGHIEDIVSHEDFRCKGIGRTIVQSLSQIAKDEGCYKVALQCKEHNVEFYQQCGYEVSGVTMQRF
jgi:GNAT superfamily N-acetyltransferase